MPCPIQSFNQGRGTLNIHTDRRTPDQGTARRAPTENRNPADGGTPCSTRRNSSSILAAALLFPAAAWAAPKVAIAITAEKEIVVTENGQKVTRRVPATEAAPGETIIYTLDVANTGDETATNVVVNDPIPEGTAYVPGSATEVGEVTFSIDDGEDLQEALPAHLRGHQPGRQQGQTHRLAGAVHQYPLADPAGRGRRQEKLSFQVKVQVDGSAIGSTNP